MTMVLPRGSVASWSRAPLRSLRITRVTGKAEPWAYSTLSKDPNADSSAAGFVYAPGTPVAVWG